MRGILIVSLACLATGCVATPRFASPSPSPAVTPRFDAFAFFAGRLEGEGRLARIAGGAEQVRVDSRGRVDGDTLRLDQTVHEGDKPARTRHWLIREEAPGRYRGTLSGAEGAVVGESSGNRLHLAFILKGGLPTDQVLILAPDGRSAANVMRVHKLGLTVAVLAETIRKLD